MSATASSYSTRSAFLRPAARAAGFWRLAWKEYRTVRLFWLSIIGLVVMLQWLMITFSQDTQTTLSMIFNFALGAPAFFAVGCAGSMFAAEKEEGTFEFLRIAPVSAGQVLASKLVVTALATVAMFAVLWPLALLFSGNRFPESLAQLHGMLGLWLVGALEAIAWGTLFSLLGARPLVAVILAMAAASTCAHAISWEFRESGNYSFEWSSYFRSAPWRAILALAVLGVDVFLGLRWLAGDKQKKGPTSASALAPVTGSDADRVSWLRRMTAWFSRSKALELQPLFKNPDRSAALGHLLWQCWRQSRWLMLVMIFVGIPATVFAEAIIGLLNGGGHYVTPFDEPLVFMIGVWASLAGTMVFLPDQERRNYRFFAEHNTPPRYVWLTRQLLWTAVAGLAVFAVCVFWLVNRGDMREIWQIISHALRIGFHSVDWQSYPWYIQLPPIHLALACAAVTFSAGQWVSIFVRSGILAGFLGLLLSTVLCGWLLLMHTMQVSFWWSVFPIPLVLLWASWLRAPDWISENRRWSARAKAAAAVLVPALTLMIAVPMHRVHQVPADSPGFDLSQYEAQIKAKLESGLATAKMYEDAYKACRGLELDLGSFGPNADHLTSSQELAVAAHQAEIKAALKRALEDNSDQPDLRDLADRYVGGIGGAPTEAEKKWLENNANALELLMKAAQRPNCTFYDPASAKHFTGVTGHHVFVPLLLTSGRQLQAEGKLDEALDRYLATLRVISDTYSGQLFFLPPEMLSDVRSVFVQIAHWAGEKGQTPERLRAAIGRLQATEVGTLRMEELVKNNYILARRLVMGDSDLRQFYYPRNYSQLMERELLWSTLMPWENDRAMRVLDMLTKSWLYRLQLVTDVLRQQGQKADDAGRGLSQIAGDAWRTQWIYNQDEIIKKAVAQDLSSQSLDELKEWLATTNPDLSEIERLDHEAAKQMIGFEAQKRGAMLVLAIEAYRLEHGELPSSLADLQGKYFQRWPVDPYSGYEFRYFPHGILLDGTEESADATVLGIWQRFGGPNIVPGQPGVWSTGPNVIAELVEENPNEYSETVNPEKKVRRWTYRYRFDDGQTQQLPLREIWRNGFWFPIPETPK